MIIYEVTLSVDDSIAAAYRLWLRDHIADMLTLPGFVEAQCFERLDNDAAPARPTLVVAYRLRDEAALQAYFAEHAPRLREDGQRRFPGQFTATRRVLRELIDFVAPAR